MGATIGTQTVRVDRNQLRPAYGFESWSPTDEDIKALKTCFAVKWRINRVSRHQMTSHCFLS